MDVSIAVDALFGAVVPERLEELRDAWAERDERVRLTDSPRQFLFAQYGGTIQVNEIALRQTWLTGYAAWKAVQAYVDRLKDAGARDQDFDPASWHLLPDQRDLDNAFDELLDLVDKLSDSLGVDEIDWPDDIPYPQQGLSITDPEKKATFDLVCMAGAYIFAHEVRHDIIEAAGQRSEDILSEEQECDRWALDLLIEQAAPWATSQRQSPELVVAKRVLGVVIAHLTMLAVTPRSDWDADQTHLPIRKRLRTVLEAVHEPTPEWFWVTVSAMFTAFLRRTAALPAPKPFPSEFRELAFWLCDHFRST